MNRIIALIKETTAHSLEPSSSREHLGNGYRGTGKLTDPEITIPPTMRNTLL